MTHDVDYIRHEEAFSRMPTAHRKYHNGRSTMNQMTQMICAGQCPKLTRGVSGQPDHRSAEHAVTFPPGTCPC